MKICAVVVTYNRVNLLKICLDQLISQTYKLDEIIVINNASTDGTEAYLDTMKDKISVINMLENIGGAGGFNEGIKIAYNKGYDYIWVMDDDTIATDNALESMVNKFDLLKYEKVGYLCSNVLFKDEQPCIMNIPSVHPIFNKYVSDGLIKLESTSFVSILLNRDVIKTEGLPIKDFFIWGDDLEYTRRISKVYSGYLVTSSRVYHYMNENKGIDIVREEGDRIKRYIYQFRNRLFISRTRGLRYIIKDIAFVVKTIIRVLKNDNTNKIEKITIILKGSVRGIFFNPKIEYID